MNWFTYIKAATERLVAIRGISPSEEENLVASKILELLYEDGIEALYTASGFDPIANDPYGRKNVYAFLRGQRAETLILLGHFDTVDTADYGDLESLSLDPGALALHIDELLAPGTRLEGERSNWLFGRGAGDMKSGVAVNIALMRHLAERSRSEALPFSVLLIATADEENESAGVLQAVHFLTRWREERQLHYLGVLNTDYASALYPGDPHRYIYAGTVGKLLPSFLCIGRESHVGAPFGGLDANLLAAELIRDFSMNDALSDSGKGQTTVPPVTLHSTDLKQQYDVQLPFAAYFYLNVLTLTSSPAELLQRLRERSELILEQLLRRVEDTERRWRRATGLPDEVEARKGCVLSYAELYADVVAQLGEESVHEELEQTWQKLPVRLDKRERSLQLVRRLWSLSRRRGPAVVIYYAPPYYPHVPESEGLLAEAVRAVVEAHPEQHLIQREFFPLLSDISYLQLDANMDIAALTANMPVWQDAEEEPSRPGAYSLPLSLIQQLQLPVFNWGVHGRGAHQRDEAVQMPYSFEVLPQLLAEVFQALEERLR
ncbi:M20/M25/M40 family metallo-hydrolase [Ktedonospora formicarum]|nr:M20/M25/M40 family metallo-hydrolase [Ktedonospora formicarum]